MGIALVFVSNEFKVAGQASHPSLCPPFRLCSGHCRRTELNELVGSVCYRTLIHI